MVRRLLTPRPQPVRPTSQYVRLFSGLRRSTSREYLVLLADDQMPERDVGTAVYGEGHSRPARPHSRVRGVERLHRLPAQAGVPQHRWGVFLNDFDQFIHGRGGWAERATSAAVGPVWMSSNAPAGAPERRRSAVAHLRRQDQPMETDWAAFQVNGE